ncbi:MAG: Hsp20/alpha crystallin family protein [Candidatus Paceibacterota bacterium]|jgi:HSP20 family protein|nr:Hsp20/alpha crystallin family protein [Candidatus Paceibacterota bacterium]
MHNTNKKRSFFGWLKNFANDEESDDITLKEPEFPESNGLIEETKNSEGELAIDVYQTATEIIVQTMPAGVRPDDLVISITPETVMISGKREAPHGVNDESYMLRELYWGSFSRTIVLPEEIQPDEAEAIEKHGLLVIRLPKLDKTKQHRLKVKMV